jgi:hypothetical protein
MGGAYETEDWKRLVDKRWSEFSDSEKRQLILIGELHLRLNLLLNTIETSKPVEAREIQRFKNSTLERLALPDPFDGDDPTDDEIADRDALFTRVMAGR